MTELLSCKWKKTRHCLIEMNCGSRNGRKGLVKLLQLNVNSFNYFTVFSAL